MVAGIAVQGKCMIDRTNRGSAYRQEPCIGCKYRGVCSAQNLACVKFVRFTATMHGKLQKFARWPDAPHPEIYATIFSGEEDEAVAN